MFSKRTAARINDVTFTTKKKGDDTIKIVVLTLMLQPFTPEMANDLNVKRHLFGATDGEPLSDLLGIELAINEDYQRVHIRMAPDQDIASVEIPNVEVRRKLKVRRDKEGPVYAAILVLEMAYPSGNDLLFLASRVNELDYFDFEPEQGDMLDTSEGRQPALVEGEVDDKDE